ncbi:MAG: ABC transporter ATP-binding protein [Saprospiraceae bacterium]|nr:ABC transporter ATP-binding protein [Saprospiraceae bacterium]MCB9317999.1 ABC transporter ATP-binding protein [Lewinellaceae bacterium]
MIQFQQVIKKYGNQVVLDIPELEIREGQLFGLVGNNGAGKTTAFSLLLDLIPPDRGQILSKGETVQHHEGWKRYTTAFLDESFLMDFLTPEEYFNFIGELYGWGKAQVNAFLEHYQPFFNDEVLGKRKYIRDFSKGNQKKIGLIGALIGDPEVIILDEPFANLDPTTQIRFKRIVEELESTRTVLISSHDLNHITEICRRIVLLNKGKIEKDIQVSPSTLQELEDYFAG